MVSVPSRTDPAGRTELARVLLLLQGSILLVTTVEAAILGAALAGAPGAPFLITAAAMAAVFAARGSLGGTGRWPRRVLYLVEGVLVASIGIDTAFALLVTHAAPPVLAVLTRFVLPLAVIALLRTKER